MGNIFRKRNQTSIESFNILGDLNCMHKLDKWIAAGHREGTWSDDAKDIVYGLQSCAHHSDGALLLALTQLPHFNLIARIFISTLNVDELQDDKVFFE